MARFADRCNAQAAAAFHSHFTSDPAPSADAFHPPPRHDNLFVYHFHFVCSSRNLSDGKKEMRKTFWLKARSESWTVQHDDQSTPCTATSRACMNDWSRASFHACEGFSSPQELCWLCNGGDTTSRGACRLHSLESIRLTFNGPAQKIIHQNHRAPKTV